MEEYPKASVLAVANKLIGLHKLKRDQGQLALHVLMPLGQGSINSMEVRDSIVVRQLTHIFCLLALDT